MKIIHFADLHIGSKFDRLPDLKKEELNNKLRNAFTNIVDFANKRGIDTILMSGDIFDKNAVKIKDKKFFYDTIKMNSNIDFYYIRGNHDSLSNCNEEIPNLHTFEGVSSYIKGNVRIIGYELNKDNSLLYNYPSFTNDKFNIMMLHGDIFNSRDNNYIDLKKLESKNISYFALGHIHKGSTGSIGQGKYAYPGSVMGRGFDETGEKGILVLDTDTNTTTFVKMSNYEFENFDIDVTNKNEVEIKTLIKNRLMEKKPNLTEIKLVGISDFELDAKEIETTFNEYRYYLEVKNESKLKLTYEVNENENSLRNMFINKVLSDDSLDEDTKEQIINYGLSKLMKEEY